MDDVCHADKVDRAMISVNRLWSRKSFFPVNKWMMDSGAFTCVAKHGMYPEGHLEKYAQQIEKWSESPGFEIAVSQDYMCEKFVTDLTGLSVFRHQLLTISRYKQLKSKVFADIPLMPVLQGYRPEEYVDHLQLYSEYSPLPYGSWVGVGSVCKRNSNVGSVENVLKAINKIRPDLRLHGFGLKLTALQSEIVQNCLYSCDSMAWSFAARYEGRNAHDPQEAISYSNKVNNCNIQMNLFT